jgi:hypothetical protein
MNMLPLPAVLRAFHGTRNKVNKWAAAGHLTNKVPEGSPGVPSIVDRITAIEIAFMTTLTTAGYHPSDAKVIAGNWLGRIKEDRELQTVWVLNPLAGTCVPISKKQTLEDVLNHLTPADMPTGTEPSPALTVVTVNVGEIKRRVDSLDRAYKAAD